MVNGTDQAEAFRAADRAAFDRDLPEALATIADLEDAAAAQGDVFGLGCVRFQMAWHLRVAQGLAQVVALSAPLAPDEPRPALTGDPLNRHGPSRGQVQHHAPLGSYHGLGRGDHRLPPGRYHP